MKSGITWRSPEMRNRTARRKERDETNALVQKANDGELTPQQTIIDKIAAMLRDAGHEFIDLDIFRGLSPDQQNSLTNRVRFLAHTPGGRETKTFLPWAGANPSVGSLRAFMKKLPFPGYASDLMEASIKSLSTPATNGMLRNDGLPNKDLAQLLIKAPALNFSDEVAECFDIAMNRHVADFREWILTEDPFGYTISDEGHLQFGKWDIDFYREQMRNSISEASPGFPFVGLGWDDVLDDGETPFQKSYRVSMLSITDPERYAEEVGKWVQYLGFIFVQGARWTGDAGEVGDGSEGNQRLVQAACCLVEKLFSHIIAIAYKRFYKAPALSGQRGIQRVAENLQKVAQGELKPTGRTQRITHWAAWDVSKWDVAQTDEFAKKGFFEFIHRTIDPNDPFSLQIIDKYKEGYFNRVLYTAAGCFNPGFLPSGAGITTVMAFCHHNLILLTLDEIVKRRTGEYLLAEYGLQGDDFAAALSQWNPQIEELVKQVYAEFNCVIKGDMRVRSVMDPDLNVVFLGECVDLVQGRMRAKPPKWNLFMAENYRALQHGSTMDRMQKQEVLSQCPHPSRRELQMASLCSKLDLFHGEGEERMPFYDELLDVCIRWCTFPLRSWLGERVIKHSATIQILKHREEREGILWPSDIDRALDREEENWLSVAELGRVTYCYLAAAIDLDTKSHNRELISIARGFSSWRKAGNASMQLRQGEAISRNLDLDKTAKMIAEAYAKGYDVAEKERAEEEANARQALQNHQRQSGVKHPDQTPVELGTTARAIYAWNEVATFELLQKTAATYVSIFNSRNWRNRPEHERNALNQGCIELFGYALSELSTEYQRFGDV